jgi:hypothetical protein
MTIPTTSGDTPNSLEASTYSAYITEELRRYDEHLRDVRGLAAGTCPSSARSVRRPLPPIAMGSCCSSTLPRNDWARRRLQWRWLT